ncbi:hypothetical protein BC829DRAFT_245237 [Chytridium lagenaria]|nr:hypothetical protein BC829DRAFT_245237 [Chytridium lagenaria]
MRRSNVLSTSVWLDSTPPPLDAPSLTALRESLEMWNRSHVAYHTVGDGTAASSGNSEAGHFMIIFYHTAYLLAHSPRSSIDQILLGNPPDASLTAWFASPHVPICIYHATCIAKFFENMLEGGIGVDDTLFTFYDREISFLGVLGWEVMYAAVVVMLLEGAGVGSGGDVVGVLEKALEGMVVLYKGVGNMLMVVRVIKQRMMRSCGEP